MHRKTLIWLLSSQLALIAARAQPADPNNAQINWQLRENSGTFHSALRPLHQIKGAPGTFYTYFWEFGDGQFSFEPQPTHVYKDTGTYYVRLYATNNYDDGKPPPTRPKPIRIRSNMAYLPPKPPSFFHGNGALEMKVNCMPKPGEDLVLVMGYRNRGEEKTLNGSLVLFYNDRQFRRDNFYLSEERPYHGETESNLGALTASLPSEELRQDLAVAGNGPNDQPEGAPAANTKFSQLFAEKQRLFRENTIWKFENLQKGEEKYFFLTLQTTPEMIRDTNAVLSLTGMFVPDNPNEDIEQYEMELQIVASHDPNRMLLKNRTMEYRFTGTKKELTYKILFQNTGTGPAREISVGVGLPPLLDPQSVEVIDYSPKCVGSPESKTCFTQTPGSDSVHFTFQKVYLQGIRQDGMRDPDSTMGFITYRIHFNDQLKKLPFASRATIVFDQQAPVSTNLAQADFRPGRSPELIAGYGLHFGRAGLDESSDNNFSIGAGLSPFSPFRKYLQWELFLSLQNYPEVLVGQVRTVDTMVGGQTGTGIILPYQRKKVISLDLVPLQLRYNFWDWLGAGAGALAAIDAVSITKPREDYFIYYSNNPTVPVKSQVTGPASVQWFNRADLALFADLQLGKVRAGPAIGIRWLRYLIHAQNRLFIYACWRL
jgi:hypothetical protein